MAAPSDESYSRPTYPDRNATVLRFGCVRCEIVLSVEVAKMPAWFVNDPEYWRDRAKEKRILAERMKDQLSKEKILRIARDYERLAQRAEERSKSTS
jgi:hypothetical protein